jgi:hypothetical protein
MKLWFPFLCSVRSLVAIPCRHLRSDCCQSSLFHSNYGGVLVSTLGLMTGLHAEDDSLASLKIESKKSIANEELALAA